jgi:hypothetical protein
MFAYLWSLFSQFFVHMKKYINNRMDGMPYFFNNTSTPTIVPQPSKNNDIANIALPSYKNQLKIPEHIRSRIVPFGYEISGKIKEDASSSLDVLCDYIQSLDLSSHNTFHTFEECLPEKEHSAIQNIKYSSMIMSIAVQFPKHIITPIVSMNELYVTCLGAEGSDRVFETPHIDGLFAWLPWCTILRSVVSIQGNRGVDTVFPLSQHTYTLETGDYVAFDYNRSIHYIYGNTVSDNRRRIVLKLHYLVYPEWMPVWVSRIYIWIHGRYNAFLRGLFLKSQIPSVKAEPSAQSNGFVQTCIAGFINGGTNLYVKLFLICLYVYKILE